jgi:ribosomal protein S19
MLRNNKPQKYLTNKRMYEKEYYLKIKSRRYVILPTLLGFFSKVIVYIFANK